MKLVSVSVERLYQYIRCPDHTLGAGVAQVQNALRPLKCKHLLKHDGGHDWKANGSWV